MDHANHVRLDIAELNETTLMGAVIYGPDNEKIGHVSHVFNDGADCRVVIDVGGFLGIGSKPVELAARDLDFMRDNSNSVHATTRWTKAELKNMPEYAG